MEHLEPLAEAAGATTKKAWREYWEILARLEPDTEKRVGMLKKARNAAIPTGAPPHLPEYKKLMTVPGIGESLARKLAREGISLARLQRGDIPPAKLPRETELYLKYRTQTEVPRATAKKVAAQVQKQFAQFKSEVAGSIRRGRAHSKDIDIVLLPGKCKDVLTAAQIPEELIIARGEERVNFLFHYGRKYYKVDMFFANSENYYYMLMYLTGSKEFNIKCRAAAKQHGMTLNQHGLYKNGAPILRATSENDIYFAIFKKPIPSPANR